MTTSPTAAPHDSYPLHRAASNGEVLLWQCRFRVLLVALLLASWFLFRMTGLPEQPSVGRVWLGPQRALAVMLLLAGLYLGFTAAVARYLRRRRSAGTRLLVTVVAVDAVGLFGTMALVTPVEALERGLLLSFFSLQLTQLYFGRALAALSIALMTGAYVGVLSLATLVGSGGNVSWWRELWTLYIYIFGAIGFLVVQGSVASRLSALAQMFRRIEEGDFAGTYDESRDRRPDNVTLVGRAYNRMRSQLASIVLTDPLSGCLNRRGFEEQLAREVARASRSRAPLTLIALDVDHFKSINDRYGHLAGDQAIEEVAMLLRDTARAGDVVARIGGEEFMLLAPATDAAGARMLADRLVAAFRQHRFAAVRARQRVTVSVGVVTEDAVIEGIGEDLRARADEALYTAKRTGRDRVVVWTQGLQAFTTGTFAVPAG